MRALTLTALLATLAVITVAPAVSNGSGEPRYKGRTAKQWHDRAVLRREQRDTLQERLTARVKQLGRYKRVTLGRPDTLTAIRVASIVYGVEYERMLRIARCETGGTFSERSYNYTPIYNGEHATGLFQFIPSTWASTPFARFDIYNGWINALAAGWMMGPAHRLREWACQ